MSRSSKPLRKDFYPSQAAAEMTERISGDDSHTAEVGLVSMYGLHKSDQLTRERSEFSRIMFRTIPEDCLPGCDDRNSKWGLRGQRIGEASFPIPL